MVSLEPQAMVLENLTTRTEFPKIHRVLLVRPGQLDYQATKEVHHPAAHSADPSEEGAQGSSAEDPHRIQDHQDQRLREAAC